jgi:DNA-binding NarL/FixJ family response regulator
MSNGNSRGPLVCCFPLLAQSMEILHYLLLGEPMIIEVPPHGSDQLPKQVIINFVQVKVSPREQQVLNSLVQGCSNKEIGDQLHISLRTVKQHLRMLFLRAGIHEGAKRVKLARYAHETENAVMTICGGLTATEYRISILVWEGLTNREIGKIVGTSEQVIKNHLRGTYDKLGVWSRLELAMYVAGHGGKDLTDRDRPPPLGRLERSSPIPRPPTFRLQLSRADVGSR